MTGRGGEVLSTPGVGQTVSRPNESSNHQSSNRRLFLPESGQERERVEERGQDQCGWHETDQGEPAGAFPTISWASVSRIG